MGGSGGRGGGMAGDAPPGLPSAAAPKGPPEAASAPAPPRVEAPPAAPAPAASGGRTAGRTVSFSCSSCAKKLILRLSASQLASPTPITCSCSSCGSVLKINLPPSDKAKPKPPPLPPPSAAAPGPSSLRPPPAPKPAKGGAAPSAAPKTVERTFQCSCVSCGAKLRFTLSCPPNACTASTKCAMCHAELRVRIPSLKPPAPGADPSPGASSERTRAWACGVRDAAFAEEEREDTEAPLPLPEALLHWHWANLEYANGTQLHSLSNRWWDADDEFDFGGGHYLLPDGYGGLLRKVAAGLDIRLGHEVKTVKKEPRGVLVEAVNGGSPVIFTADVAICSLPLGVLKAGAVVFEPPLPPRKQEAIERLGFGSLNKVLLGFERPFWEEREGGRDFWGWTAPNGRRRGEAFQFWNLQRSTGRPLLLVLHAGRAALRKARAPLREAPGGQEAPPPLQPPPVAAGRRTRARRRRRPPSARRWTLCAPSLGRRPCRRRRSSWPPSGSTSTFRAASTRTSPSARRRATTTCSPSRCGATRSSSRARRPRASTRRRLQAARSTHGARPTASSAPSGVRLRANRCLPQRLARGRPD
ncbi:hypothetical protein EMIHUDRAFT_445147 [Emiliania huxleyi CCMP1516]|uniref:Amine oxidase domain-containing protein n=2 Tax=Emiliania huxleyi TaxID=2903 RepID=A0A0D3J4T7_EMIH1|nr:hypothetical protein EMIHUDRAFT_445147 [Emiliania huxleyi CCMP1516]EOD18522.1 hypothetical protein EMIHUDRAFT_445147 [Emiliania huxleyi CCMP1516]|eukprot:XP_005770951.1 hypothetical protein EMIHUDRAFT_445147 [Emiliania huxleyi CCMP1516]